MEVVAGWGVTASVHTRYPDRSIQQEKPPAEFMDN